MINPSLDDFARIAASHNHGQLYVSTDPSQQAAKLGRHLFRSTTPEQNVAVRQALLSALNDSVYLLYQPDVRREVTVRLGLDGGRGANPQKPLEMREVRDLIALVRQKSKQTLACLIDEGMSEQKVVALMSYLTPARQEELVRALAASENSTTARLQLLMKLHRDAELAINTIDLQRAMARGNYNYLAEFMEVHNPNLYRQNPGLSRTLFRAAIARRVEAARRELPADGFMGLNVSPRTLHFVNTVILEGGREAIRMAAMLKTAKEQLWQSVNDRAAELLVGLPKDKQLVGLMDASRYYAAKCAELDQKAEGEDCDEDMLDADIDSAQEDFGVGLKHLLTTSREVEGEENEADVYVRTSKFVTEVFERSLGEDLPDLPDFGRERLLAKVCADVLDAIQEERGNDGFSLGRAFADKQLEVEGRGAVCKVKLMQLSARRSASDEFVMAALERELTEAGLEDHAEAELDFVKRQYERQYAQRVLPRCGDPDLMLEDVALDEATCDVAKDAVQQLLAAKTLAEGVKKQVAGMVRAFHEDPEVTGQMIETLDRIAEGMTQTARTELLLADDLASKVDELTRRFQKEIAAKIKEMKDARQLNLAHKVSEKYQAVWADFDAKMKTVEGAYDAFVATLPMPKLKEGREFARGLAARADGSVELQDAWMNACSAVRAGYAQVPKDFEAELPKFAKFKPEALLATLKQEVGAIWQARCESFSGAMDELEDFLREAHIPEDVGITSIAWEKSTEHATTIREFVFDTAINIRDAALAGDKAKVRELLDGLKAAVTTFIAESNAHEFMKDKVNDGTTARSTAIAHFKVVVGTLFMRSGASINKGIGLDSVVGESITRLWDEFMQDSTHIHTRAEVVDLVLARINALGELNGKMWARLRERILQRAEPELYLVSTGKKKYGRNIDLIISTDVDTIEARYMEERRMSITHALDYDEEAMLKRMDALGDEVITKMMSSRAELLEQVQVISVRQAREKLLAYVEQRMDKLGRKEKVLETELRALTVPWIMERMDSLLTPIGEHADDGRIHGRLYREVDAKALQKELGAYIDQSIKSLLAQRKKQ